MYQKMKKLNKILTNDYVMTAIFLSIWGICIIAVSYCFFSVDYWPNAFDNSSTIHQIFLLFLASAPPTGIIFFLLSGIYGLIYCIVSFFEKKKNKLLK